MGFRTVFLLMTVLLGGAASAAYAQAGSSERVRPIYYLDLNLASPETIHLLEDASLNLQYFDAYGGQSAIVLKLYNWKREVVAAFQLSKTYGLNHFRINLGATYSAWQVGEVYTCELLDESQHRYELLVKKEVPVPEPPTVNLFVNPVQMQCGVLSGNVVEFYGKISGGRTPYQLHWYVLNSSQTDFLYQPREEWVEQPGQTPAIRVDENPDYYVLLQVKDACGNEQQQMVHLVCQDKLKKVNTIFVEPLKELPARNPQKLNK